MRIDFTDVGITRAGRDIVRGATFGVGPGQIAGLVGPNGSGKSTLLRSLYRVVRPDTGSVRIDGRDVWRLPGREVARQVAVMAQETSADFDLGVLDVVLLGRLPHQRGFGADSPHDLRLADAALDRVGARHLADRPFAALSGGEKQRVLLARALVQESRVLVLDEPTNHLDIAFQLELMRIVGDLGLTTIAALHDLNLAAAHCDVVAVLHAGRIVAHGPPGEVLTAELLHEVFGVRAHLLPHPATGKPLIAFSPAPSAHAPAGASKEHDTP
ncbi:ABC transporter ATP-binding protein [Allostreptomyces psammosilenae]|uniref:Iron complex transport system ATP-binding protein n=1 Tax=Allostreptomyces psammosilenae TaxID=1892865 RepID=A0A852ZQL3_9ACTN|nr:ABC transporter ATP-binding protein [Allostreptomyces psammosilenae]NYI04693.1 iron complex transport system ATP-binding protein [Allostreptomyces psammosilenae]